MHEKMHRSKLTEYQEIDKEHFLNKKIPDNLIYQYLTLRKGILYEQSWLAWYRECMKMISIEKT